MNKIGSLESQLMDAFKEKEEKEVATTAVDAQKLQDKEIAEHALGLLCTIVKSLMTHGVRKTRIRKRQLRLVGEKIGD